MITRYIIGIGRHMRDAFRNFFRNFGLSLSALASINVTLIVVSIAVLLSVNFDSFATEVENDVEIVAFIDESVLDSEIPTIKSELEKMKQVASVKYSTKEEEMAILTEKMSGLEAIAEQYQGDENPLYRTFYIRATDVREINGLVKEMEKTSNYVEIKYGADVVEKIVSLLYYARLIALVVIGLLLLVTAFIIFNTIRITIYTRSTQVEIMKLIGASNYHITMPYVYEGILIGVFGSILPIVLTVVGYDYFYKEYADNQFIKSFFTLTEPFPTTLYIALGMLVVGVFVGVFGSTLSIRKFVRR